MGNGTSLTTEEVNKLQNDTRFTGTQIKRVHKRFRRLDKSDKGYVTPIDFAKISEIEKSTLGDRVCSALSTPSGAEIDFKKFLQTLSDFNFDRPKDKIMFLFKVYDVNNDGYIDKSDLFTVMRSLVGDDLNIEQINEIVEKTMLDLDENKDGKLSFEEFAKVITGGGLF